MTNGSISHLGLKGVLCLSFAHSFLCHTGWMAYWISRSRFWETRIPLVNIFQHAEKKPMCFVRWKMATRWRRLTTFTMPLYLCKSAFLNDLRAKLLLQSAPILHLRFAELKIIGWPVFNETLHLKISNEPRSWIRKRSSTRWWRSPASDWRPRSKGSLPLSDDLSVLVSNVKCT